MNEQYPVKTEDLQITSELITSVTNRPKEFLLKGNAILLLFVAASIYAGKYIWLSLAMLIVANAVILLTPDHKIADICRDAIVIYDQQNPGYARMIRYDEIVSWRLLNDGTGTVEILTGDPKKEEGFRFETPNDVFLYRELMKVIPDSNQSRKQMNQIMESRGSLESLPEMIAGRLRKLFGRK